MLVLTVISFDCRLLRSRLQLDHELQSTPHQLAQAPYKQILISRLFRPVETWAARAGTLACKVMMRDAA